MSFNGNKRRRDEDEEDFPTHGREEFPSQHQRRSNQPFQKRPRQELSQELQLAIKLCEDITKLGEKPLNSFANDINYMSFPISEEISESDEIRNALLKTFYAVITEQPHKLQLLGALLEICNLRNSIVGKYVFEYLHKRAQELVDSMMSTKDVDMDADAETSEVNHKTTEGNLNNLKLIMRFFAINRKLVANDGILKIFEQFLRISVELSSTEKRNAVAEAIFYNTVISIPYLKFYGEADENIKSLLAIAHDFKIVDVHSCMSDHFDDTVVKFSKPYGEKSLIKLVLPAIETYVNDDQLSFFIETQELIAPLLQELNNYESTVHSLPQFNISAEAFADLQLSGEVDSLWSHERIFLEVYQKATNEFETKPEIESFFGLLLNDICQDMILRMEFNKGSVAQQLMMLDQYFKPKTFSKLASSIDKLTILNDKQNGTVFEIDPADPASGKIQRLIDEVDADFEEGYTSTWKIEDTLTESILNLIFNLPDVSTTPIIFFYTVLVDCCSRESKAMAPVFGRAIRFFFTNITILDFELRSRYLDWLAVQLSNFRFQWKWHEWSEYIMKLEDLQYHPIMIFIKNLIAKEIRLSSVKKIKDTLPEEFHKYLDISLDDKSSVAEYDSIIFGKAITSQTEAEAEENAFKFLSEENESRAQCQEIVELLGNNGLTADQLLEKLEALKEKSPQFKVNLVFQSICHLNSRSISHVKFFIETNKEILMEFLKQFNDSLDTKTRDKYVIESVLRIWNHEPQIGFLILEMLLLNEIIGWESYLSHLFVKNAVILNISAVESLLRILSNLSVYHIDESSIFDKVLELILEKLNNQQDHASEIIVEDIEGEKDDSKWLYSELLKLLKSLLRKYHHYYGAKQYSFEDDDTKIANESTAKIIKGYLKDLKNNM